MRGELTYDRPVTLVGGGALDSAMLAEATALAPTIIAADGAGERLIAMGRRPAAVIGDMDSTEDAAALARKTRVVALAEQDTTDFEKCLYTVSAPLYVAVGFTGGRLDHTLAVFDAALRRPEQTVVLLGEDEVAAPVPENREMDIEVGTGARVSFVGLRETTGILSGGLQWSIKGVTMTMGRRTGTSNRATAAAIRFAFDRPGALVMLERSALRPLVAALGGI